MKRQTKIITVILAIGLVGVGGYLITVNDNLNKVFHTKTDLRTEKEKQLDYLKKHEKEMTDYVKSRHPKVESVQFNWDHMIIEEIGNGTPQGGGINLSLPGKFNNIKDSQIAVDFPLESRNALPNIEEIGMLNPPRTLRNGVWYIYE